MRESSRSLWLGSAATTTVLAAVRGMQCGPDEMVAVLMADGGEPALGELVEALSELEVSFFGGVFPGLIDGRQRREHGVLLVVLPKLGEPALVESVDGGGAALPDLVPRLAEVSPHRPTAIVLVDGLASCIDPFLQQVYHQLGNRVRYWGGGAGSLSLEPRDCLFTAAGVVGGGAVVALTPLCAGLGVRHGWRLLHGPLVATRSERNVVRALNWRAAFDVYRDRVEADAGTEIDPAAPLEVMQVYPFGIECEGREVVVRDPIAIGEDGSLVCVGAVPENAVLTILKGEPEALVEAAGQAAAEAAARAASAPVRHCLVADCVSRVTFLGARFDSELAAIEAGLGAAARERVPCGVLTLGEVSSGGEDYLEYFNKTAVVAVLYEPAGPNRPDYQETR